MPSKNDLWAIKLKTQPILDTSQKSWRPPKAPIDKCSEAVVLKFTPLEFNVIKQEAWLVPLATFLKSQLDIPKSTITPLD